MYITYSQVITIRLWVGLSFLERITQPKHVKARLGFLEANSALMYVHILPNVEVFDMDPILPVSILQEFC